MKWMLFTLLIFSLDFLAAQHTNIADGIVFVSRFETMPKWTNGTNAALIEKITASIIIPNEECLEVVTLLRFKVDTLGQVSAPQILRSVSKKIDEQLLNMICNYEFISATFMGEKVDVLFNLPVRISFK